MKRWMDRTNGRVVSTLSSKINKFENLKFTHCQTYLYNLCQSFPGIFSPLSNSMSGSSSSSLSSAWDSFLFLSNSLILSSLDFSDKSISE